MTYFVGGGFGFVSRILQGIKLHNRLSRACRKTIADAIEKVVGGSDPRIRIVGAYKRALRPMVESSFAYLDDLVAGIPGVIAINKGSFATDPRVHAFFITVEDLQNKFSRSPELRRFIENDDDGGEGDIFALLCMRLKEKTVYGMALKGEIIKRDVKQISVGFSDHQLLAPASTEQKARQGLRQCLFEQLIATISDGIDTVQAQRQDLESQRRLLQTQLKGLEAKNRRSESTSQSIPHTLYKLEQKLTENEEALSDLKSRSTPRYSLDHACEILSQPENYIKVKKLHMRLNNMSIKLREDSPETGYEIELAELIQERTPSRVVVLAKYPRNEILPKEDFLKQVTPYLST
jgi:hypothetical protein